MRDSDAQLGTNHCVFTRGLIPRLEKGDRSLENHLRECPHCQKAAIQWEAKIEEIKGKIPLYRPKPTQQALIKSECYQMLELRYTYPQKTNQSISKLNLSVFAGELLNAMLSLSFIKVLALTLLSFWILQSIL